MIHSIVTKNWECTVYIGEAAALSPVADAEMWLDYYRCCLLTQPQ